MQQRIFFFMLALLLLLSCTTEKEPPKLSTTTLTLPPSPKLTPEEEAKKFLPRWIKGLQNRDPKFRQEMIQRIWDMNGWKEESAKNVLLLSLRLEEDAQVWNFLKNKIWDVDPDQVIAGCFDRFRDPRVLFRFASFKLLKEWIDPRWKSALEKMAQDSQDVAMPYAVLLLGHPEQNSQSLETLKNIASRDNFVEPPLAIDILIPLIQTDPQVKMFLQHLLVEHVSSVVRLHCLRKLASVLPVEEVVVALKDTEGSVRLELIQQMIFHPVEKTGEWLFQASQDIENRPDIRKKALEGLFQIQSPKALEACSLLLLQRSSELYGVAIGLAINHDPQEICWLAEALLCSSKEEALVALNAPQLPQFPQLRVLLELFQKSEDYELRSKSEAILKLMSAEATADLFLNTPQNTFELMQKSMLRFCLSLAFSCFSAEYQRQNPSLEQTLMALQNPVFRLQHRNFIQELQWIEVSIEGETAIGKLNRGEMYFIQEHGQWKINRIQLH